MKHLDDFTVDYLAIDEGSNKFLELLKKFESETNKTFSLGNNSCFGRLHVSVYTVQENEKPTLLLWVLLHGDEAFDALIENGVNFGETDLLRKLDFIRVFKDVRASLISADEVDSDFPMIINGVDSVICFVNFEDVRAMNRNELSKVIVKEYVRRVFGIDKEFTVRTDDMSVF